MTDTNEAPNTSLALIPRTIADTMQVCDYYSKSQLIPDFFKRTSSPRADLFLAISFGMDLGFSPAASLRAVVIIKGKPGLYADAMVALCLGSGAAKFFRPVEVTADHATWETCRKGEKKVHRQTFTLVEAKAAGCLPAKPDSGWARWPQRMMSARAKSFLARDIYPEVLHGVYSAEEIGDIPDRELPSADFGPVIDVPADAPNRTIPMEEIQRAETEDIPGEASSMVCIDQNASAPIDVLQAATRRRPEKDFVLPAEEPPSAPPPGDPAKPTLLEQLEQAPTLKDLRAVGVLCADVEDANERQVLHQAFAARAKELG